MHLTLRPALPHPRLKVSSSLALRRGLAAVAIIVFSALAGAAPQPAETEPAAGARPAASPAAKELQPAEPAASGREAARGFGLTVKNSRLVFASIADYQRAVDEPSEETKKQVAGTIAGLKGFTAFAQKQNPSPALRGKPEAIAALINEGYFASLLNSDLTLQIGDYLYRVNPSTDKVYALRAADEKDYGDLLAENTRNPRIRTFSTDDNVLESIQAQNPAAKSLICNQSGIGSRHDAVLTGGFTVSADFCKYGLYYSLFAMVSPYGSSSSPFNFDFTGGIPASKGYIFYRVRCGNTVSYAINSTGSWTGQTRRYQSYQGSKNLNQVYFYFRLLQTNQPPTRYIGFRVNK